VQGDFGNSFVYKTRTVSEIIVQTFPISLLLGSMALALAVVGGLTLGSSPPSTRTEPGLRVGDVATVGVAVPTRPRGLPHHPVLVRGAALPTGGWDSPRNWCCRRSRSRWPDGDHRALHACQHARVIRADYTLTARPRAGRVPVIFKHALKTPLSRGDAPGPDVAAVGTGSFFVESIFRVPGMGRFFVLSMTGRDYPMIMAVVLTYGAFLAIMNLVVDLLYGSWTRGSGTEVSRAAIAVAVPVEETRIRSSSLWRTVCAGSGAIAWR